MERLHFPQVAALFGVPTVKLLPVFGCLFSDRLSRRHRLDREHRKIRHALLGNVEQHEPGGTESRPHSDPVTEPIHCPPKNVFGGFILQMGTFSFKF